MAVLPAMNAASLERRSGKRRRCAQPPLTARGQDTKRLYYLAGKLDTAEGPIKGWKLKVGQTAKVAVP